MFSPISKVNKYLVFRIRIQKFV